MTRNFMVVNKVLQKLIKFYRFEHYISIKNKIPCYLTEMTLKIHTIPYHYNWLILSNLQFNLFLC